MSAGTARYVLGLDLGTSSLKALLLRDDGALTVTAQEYPIQVPQPGWAEQQPEHWWEAVCAATRALLDESGARPEQIAAVCPGGQMHGTVLLDGSGEPVRPAIIWPDQRAAAEVQATEEALQRAGLIARLGGGVATGFMLVSLLWCRDHEPELWKRSAVALLPKDYLRYRLTGELACEPSDGSGIPAVDLFERVSGTSGVDHCWCGAALDLLGLPGTILPPLLPSGAVAGVIDERAAAATGLRAGTPVLCGGSDQSMAAIGAGLLSPGTMLISLSTGGQIVTVLDAPLRDPKQGLRTICHALPHTYLTLTATLGVGISVRWLRENILGMDGADRSSPLGPEEEAPAGAGGLLFLPYLAGERSPILDPATSGAFVGLRMDHGRPHLARAVLEGIAFSLRHALEPLREAGVRPGRVILAGGLARSALMRGIMAAMLEHPVETLETAEQSALGAALLAACFAGFYPDLHAACRATVRYGAQQNPDPGWQEQYTRLFPLYRGLYPLLRDTTHALRAASS